MSVKRALLPHLPSGAMKWYRCFRDRYRMQSNLMKARFGHGMPDEPSTINVDILADRTRGQRWLLSTGNTYRVIEPPALGPVPDRFEVIPSGAATGDASRLLGRPGVAAVVVGGTKLPVITPDAIVIHTEILDEVGGVPDGPDPLPGLLERLTDAGHPIGLIPTQAKAVERRRRDPIIGESVVILAAVPLHDVGGGSRGAQMAQELVGRGYHVTYVNRYPSYEDVDLGLRFIHPRLEQVSFARFDPVTFTERCTETGGLVIVEIPDPSYGRTLEHLKDSGWQIVFDIIDDWSDRALGGDWYDQTFEREIIADADAVVASAPDLVDRAATAGRDDAVLVPNAVNAAVFTGDERERPTDLPAGSIIGYHGSLYGNWIDWSGIAAVANANPASTIALIGEARNVPGDLPANVVFLGLKAQGDLPGYLGAFDVGIVPFTISPTTHAVSPLKVYEYLASGVPVAAPPLRALDGLEGVYTDSELAVAVETARRSPRPDPVAALVDHSWGERLSVLFEATGRSLHELTDKPVRVERRPVVHYRWRERHVRR